MTAKHLRQTGISFFLGAGASMEMGFPSGDQLKRQIVSDLANPRHLLNERRVLEVLSTSRATVRSFAQELNASGATSIDQLLDANREFLAIGRLAVWLCIMEAERRALQCDLRDYWMYRFLDRLFDEVRRSDDLYRNDAVGSGVEFLHGLAVHTLNYDRLVEHAIIMWIKDRFPELDFENGNCASNLDPGAVVRHAHGSLGPLLGKGAVPFGSDIPGNKQQILELASRLRFWFEPNNVSDVYDITNRILELRGVHVITGYGYHRAISNRFRPPTGADSRVEQVIATSHKSCRDKAERWLSSTYSQPNIRLHHLAGNAKCRDLLPVLFAENSAGFQ